MAQKATLINQAGNKVVVDAGSQQAQQYFGQGYKLQTQPTTTPKVNVNLPPKITTDNFNKVPDVTTPEPPIDTTDAFVASLVELGKSSADFIKKQEAQRTQEVAKKTETQSKIDKLISAEGTKGAALTAQENIVGVPEQTQKLADINTQIAAAKAKYDTAIAANQGRVASASSIYGRGALYASQAATELGGLSSMAQAIQGNISAAKQTAKDTIDNQYAATENELKLQLQQLSNIYNDLSANDKKRADELALVLGKQKDDIATAKETKKNIADLMISVGKTGQADAETLKKILNAKSYEEAASLAAPYLGDKGTWEESDVTDANGNPMLFNKSTGEYKTVTGSDATASFSDANGDSWNISGWATDQTKANQMQSIANKIGKVDDSNIEEKVKQFTPGLTADMIKQASANSGVSWEALMTMVNQESTGGISNVAKNNNNFGGLTWSANTQWQQAPYNGTIGTARPEGGNYIKFPTKQAGLNAMADLMAQYGKVEAPTPETQDISQEARNWAEQIVDGTTNMSSVQGTTKAQTAKLRQEVINAISVVKEERKNSANSTKTQALSLVNELANSKNLGSATGKSGALTRWIPGTNNYDFNQKYKQLRDLLAAENLGKLKGAMSDKDIEFLRNTATALNINSSSDAFKKELAKIKEKLGDNNLINTTTIGTTESGNTYTTE